ncbi:MAG: tetratricopeptide repeat protein [Chitinophagaceae bacterium]|nr:tetratricopeptide repeat protein [Chitinophagaceae bacterium]
MILNLKKQVFFLFFCVISGSLYGQKRENVSPKDSAEAIDLFMEGERYFLIENYPKSKSFFEKSMRLNPHNAAVHYRISCIYEQSQDMEKAIFFIENALEREKNNKYYYLLAIILYDNVSRFDKAAERYEQMISTIANTEIYYFDLTSEYIQLKQYEKALSTLEKAEKYYGFTAEISERRQEIYIQQKNMRYLTEELKKYISTFPPALSHVILLVRLLVEEKKTSEATKLLEGNLEKYPDNMQLLIMLSEIYKNNKQLDKSLEILKKMFSIPHNDPSIKIQSLEVIVKELPHKVLGEHARELAEIIRNTHPEYPNAYNISGDIEMIEKNKELAVVYYKKSLSLDESQYNVWRALTILHSELSNHTEAIKNTTAALELFPNQAELYYFNGASYSFLKQHTEAIHYLEMGKKYVQFDPQGLENFNALLGDEYNYVQNHEKSDNAYEEVLKINPNNDYVLNNYAYFLSLRKEKLDKAIIMGKKVIENNPTNATYLDTYAWVLYMKGNYFDAKVVLEKALQDTKNISGTIIEHYGDVLFKLGKTDLAVEEWKKAKEMKNTSTLIDKKIIHKTLYEE